MDVPIDTGIPFSFDAEIGFFEKASAPEGQRRRFGGLVSLETKDQQGETLLQDGLDFSHFLRNGWFNDNHSKATDGIVGYPDPASYRIYAKGERLPDGLTAHARGTWVEGWMLEGTGNDPCDRLWRLGRSLGKTPRRLGFSVEGSVLRRIGLDRKTVAEARVRNVAITNCPVNSDTRLQVLAKSLDVVRRTNDTTYERFVRALTNERTGSTPVTASPARTLTQAETLAIVRNRYPDVSEQTINKIAKWAFDHARGYSHAASRP